MDSGNKKRKLRGPYRRKFETNEDDNSSLTLLEDDTDAELKQCEPALWDAKYFSAQSRARFFWGNIPGMYSTPDLRQLASPASLNTVLSPYCHRRATVERLRCVTTRSNSLRLGKDDKGFPIKMNGKECSIWIPELERLFGFPAHYTDVANLPTTRRQKLLGRAWSVPVIKHLLTPLKHYFASRKPE